jgi:CubicO group peptidase (beta-lactamase class C family)
MQTHETGFVSRCLFAAGALLCCLGAPAAPEDVAPNSTTPAAATAGADLNDRSGLEAFFDGVYDVAMKEHHVSGAVISIVKDGELLFAKGYGHQDIDKDIPIDPRTTLFRIGSTTKLLTWTAVMQLVEQGKLDLDTDVNQYLKGVQIPATYDKPITLRHLMTHTSGFEEGYLGYLMADDPQHQQSIAQLMRQHVPERVRPPGEMSSYSNYGAALAGLIVEQVSGVAYDDYIAKHIFEPLDMQFATTQEPVPERLRPNVATSYKQENGAPVAQDYEVIGGFRPAGAAAVSALDMTHFMLAHLRDGRYGDRAILQPETAQRMHATSFQLDPRLPGMALGFYHSSINGFDAIGHGGDTNYCHTDMILVPSRQLGVFVSFYTEDGRVPARVTAAFFDRYFPRSASAGTAQGGDVVAAAQRYAGSYQFTRRNYSKIEKALALTSQLSVAPLPNGNIVLSGLDRERWQFQPLGENLYGQIGGKARLTFRSNASGKPTHLFFDFLPFMPAERTPWYETQGMWYTTLAAAFLIFASALIRAGFRRHEMAALPAPQRWAQWLATAVSGWAVLTVVVIAIVISVAGTVLFHRIPASLKVALSMPVIFVALTALLLLTTVRVWRARYWTTRGRIFFTLVTLAAIALSAYFWQYNVLGWQFG